MTSEQIASLRRRADLRPDAITWPMVGNFELARLLDEREALLEFLRKLRRELPFDEPREREVAAAIAKAEAP